MKWYYYYYLFIIIIMIITYAFKCNLKELKTKSALSARGPQLFDMYMPSISLHPSCEFSGASATRFLSAIFFSTLPPYSTNREKHSSVSCVSSYTTFMFQLLPVCLTFLQNRAQSRHLYLLHIKILCDDLTHSLLEILPKNAF